MENQINISDIWPEWEIIEEIGSGSFGTVYKAARSAFGETFFSAVKVITIPQKESNHTIPLLNRNEKEVRSYYEKLVSDCAGEISALIKLQGNSHVVNIQDFKVVKHDQELLWDIYIRMELLQSLDDYLAEIQILQEDEICKLGIDICNALVQCQKEQIIHRDIKPANIFITKHGDFKLGDFGIAKHLEKTRLANTRTGSPNFMAPEVYAGKKYDYNVDIYGLGLLLYYLLNNNRIPFLDQNKVLSSYDDQEKAFYRRIHGEAVPFPCNASPELGNIILRAIQFSPEKRYQSAREMQEALSQYIQKKQNTPEESMQSPSRMRFLWTPVILVIVMIIAGAGLIVRLTKTVSFDDPSSLSSEGEADESLIDKESSSASGLSSLQNANNEQSSNVYNTKGNVRIINKKYSESILFDRLASRFMDVSGIDVSVVSPSPGKYSDFLNDNLTGSSDDPTLFMLGGLGDFEKFGFECLDLSEAAVTKELVDDEYRLLGTNGKTYGIACVIESYGLTVNTRLLEKAGYSLSDITCFQDLKHISEDITKRENELGFSAFTSATIGNSDGSYRLSEHAPAIPLYYELRDNDFNIGMNLHGTYLDQFKDYVDLVLNHTTSSGKESVGQSLEEARKEFLSEKAVFHQDGSWGANDLQIALRKQAAVIPIYMGMPGEESQGINITCSYYWCVNKHASADDIEATLQFLQWISTSKEAIDLMTEDMGYLVPFKNASVPDNIYLQTLYQNIEDGKIPVQQFYRYGNGRAWASRINNAIESYAAGYGDWDQVREAFITLW